MERRLERMRFPDVRAYLERSDAVIIPVGTTEAHGSHLPYGTDRFVAEAAALLLADRADALVAPTFAYSWPGATAALPGTLGVAAETVMLVVRQICLACIEQGFRRLVVTSGHAPDAMTLGLAVRAVYEQTGVPVILATPYGRGRSLSSVEPLERMNREREQPGFMETSMVMAALEVLGIQGAVDMTAQPLDPVPLPAMYREASRAGVTVGYYYTDASQHVPKPRQADPELGRQMLEAMVTSTTELLESLREAGNEARERAFSWVRSGPGGRLLY